MNHPGNKTRNDKKITLPPPDEEIGRGVDKVDIKSHVYAGYTMDGEPVIWRTKLFGRWAVQKPGSSRHQRPSGFCQRKMQSAMCKWGRHHCGPRHDLHQRELRICRALCTPVEALAGVETAEIDLSSVILMRGAVKHHADAIRGIADEVLNHPPAKLRVRSTSAIPEYENARSANSGEYGVEAIRRAGLMHACAVFAVGRMALAVIYGLPCPNIFLQANMHFTAKHEWVCRGTGYAKPWKRFALLCMIWEEKA